MKLELAPRFLREAERCAIWWRKNRPAARFLFDEELRAALATAVPMNAASFILGLWLARWY